MIFTLEALQAHHGDSLLLHYGDPARPRIILIDGGPADTWEGVRKRLDGLMETRALVDRKLPIRLVMISHIDDDHIHGILDMTDAMVEGADPPQYDITAFWHNSFDDVVGPATTASTAGVASVQGASVDELAVKLPVDHQAQLVLASVGQGRRLRDNAARMVLDGNRPLGGLVAVDHA